MALTPEDGSGVPGADALITLEFCTTFCEGQGLTGWTDNPRSPADDDEAAIRRASTWLSNAWTWKGTRTHGRDQGQAFPRDDLTDGEGEDVGNDEVPIEIQQACAIAAAYERANPGGLSPAVTMTDRIKREKIDVLETEYFAAPQTAAASRPELTQVMDLIGGFLKATSSSLAGRAVRV
jgi:hypothetical protein